MLLYHYSNLERLDAILATGALLPGPVGLGCGDRPAVWFTKNAIWEPTSGAYEVDESNRFLRAATMNETHRAVGLIRFAVDEASAPFNWRHHTEHGGMSRATVRALQRAAVIQGSNVAEYRLAYDPVPASEWLAVEQWDSRQWVPISVPTIKRAGKVSIES